MAQTIRQKTDVSQTRKYSVIMRYHILGNVYFALGMNVELALLLYFLVPNRLINPTFTYFAAMMMPLILLTSLFILKMALKSLPCSMLGIPKWYIPRCITIKNADCANIYDIVLQMIIALSFGLINFIFSNRILILLCLTLETCLFVALIIKLILLNTSERYRAFLSRAIIRTMQVVSDYPICAKEVVDNICKELDCYASSKCKTNVDFDISTI